MARGKCRLRSHSLVLLAGSQMDGSSELYLPQAMVCPLPPHGVRAEIPPTPTVVTILHIPTGLAGLAARRSPILAIRTTTSRPSASRFRPLLTRRFGARIAIPLHLVPQGRSIPLPCNVSTFAAMPRSEEHTSELQSPDHLVCRLLLEKKKKKRTNTTHCITH